MFITFIFSFFEHKCKLTEHINHWTGLYAGERGDANATPFFWVNYLKCMQFSTRNKIYIPNFGPQTKIFLRFAPLCKYLQFAPHFLKVCVWVCWTRIFHDPYSNARQCGPLSNRAIITWWQVKQVYWFTYMFICHFYKRYTLNVFLFAGWREEALQKLGSIPTGKN